MNQQRPWLFGLVLAVVFGIVVAVIVFRPQRPANEKEGAKDPGALAGRQGSGPNVGSGTSAAVGMPPAPTTLADSARRLISGEGSKQTGADATTLDRQRAAVLRGIVRARDGAPLEDVAIHVDSHPEFGHTTSESDGSFSMAVNGGGTLCIHYAKEGFLPACRQVNVPWQDYVWLPDVLLVAPDKAVTRLRLAEDAPPQVARGTAVKDGDGERQSTLIVPKGTAATLIMADGTEKPAESLSVRATEFTVGKDGPKAMPAQLPPGSAYTYAVDLSADEVAVANAKDVRFNRPLFHYVENFLEFPVGIAVPTGYFDRDKSAWVPAESGRIIQILDVKGGLAILDVVGKGQPANQRALKNLGIDDDERKQLAALYQPGQSLWRVPIPHFSVWDCNWGFSPPGDATDPDGEANGDPNVNPCFPPGSSADNFARGSIIEIQNQVLRESLPVVGTPFRLAYSSNRVPGHKVARTVKIRLSGEKIPASLKRIELEVLVAGRKFTKEDFPAEPNLSYLYEWDGLDGFGRPAGGAQLVRVRVGYVYQGVYEQVDRFGYGGRGIPITGSRTRQEVALWREFQTTIGEWDARTIGLGGWTLDAHHRYDPAGRVLHLGGGHERRADGSGGRQAMNLSITSIAGGGTGNTIGDGESASQARLDDPSYTGGAGMARSRMPVIPSGLAVAPDGAIYVADENNRVRRIGLDGVISTVAGGGQQDPRRGTKAIDTRLDRPAGIAVAPDGTLYIAEAFRHRILRVDADGTLSIVAGTGSSGFSGDGGPAEKARLSTPTSVAVGTDSCLYIADLGNHRVRRIEADQTITTIAGTGKRGYSGEGGPATAADLYLPTSLALAPDGSVYFTDFGNYVVRRITPAGAIFTVAGTPLKDYQGGDSGDGGPATSAKLNDPTGLALGPGSSLLIADTRNHRVRRVGPDGTITTLAGSQVERTQEHGEYSGDGGPATRAKLSYPTGLATGPDGSLHIFDGTFYIRDPQDTGKRSPSIRPRVRRVAPPLPGFGADEIVIPSEDGREVYRFDAHGRHLETLNGLTKSLVFRFRYDEFGGLTKIEDAFGNTTIIERDIQGVPQAIVAPFGQRTKLTLGTTGYAAALEKPAGASEKFTYDAGGLLTSYTNANGQTSKFHYDDLGRLVRDEDAAGGFTALARKESAKGYEVALTTPVKPASKYSVTRSDDGGDTRRNQCCCGAETLITVAPDGTPTIQHPDGTVTTRTDQADPRFGGGVLLPHSTTLATPGGRKITTTFERRVILADRSDPFSVQSISDTTTVGGRKFGSDYDAAKRQFVSRTPLGRTRSLTIDEHGRTVRSEVPGLFPAEYTYDDKGRLAKLTQGEGAEARTVTIEYGPQGRVARVIHPLKRTLRLEYDAAGRLVTQSLPGDRKVAIEYDAAGNPVSVLPPGKPAHRFSYSPVGSVASYAPPKVGSDESAVRLTYDADRKPTRARYSDGTAVDIAYDKFGRVETLTHSDGRTTYGYDPKTDQLVAIDAGEGGTLSYSYDGALLTETQWGGPVSGAVRRTYDDNLRVSEIRINGSDAVNYQYDDDGLLVRAGELTLERDAKSGVVRGTKLGNVTTTQADNGFGERSEYKAKFKDKELFAVRYERDALGRIAKKIETIEGRTDTYEYRYDDAGRLAEVFKDGRRTAKYEYDANGNRLKQTTADGKAIAATYDEQDRLIKYGESAYRYNAAGQLVERRGPSRKVAFQNDRLGNLRAAIDDRGPKVEYVVDGAGRRVGRKVDGKLVQGFLYQDWLKPIAELNGDGQLVSQFIYAGNRSVPGWMRKSGRSFRIVSDHVGSPRLVVDAQTGDVVQRVEYDEFGNIVSDSSPGFQPFGFAGGLFDRQTGLVHFGLRDYAPEIGRWTAIDPLLFQGGDANLYAYVGNDSINRIDPTGRRGGGVVYGAAAEAGIVYGGGGQFCYGTGVVGGESGNFESVGGMIGGPGSSANGTGLGDSDTAVGAYAGVGAGGWYTNATSWNQLAGPATTISINTPLFSWQYWSSGSTYYTSFTVGPGAVASVSVYPTTTSVETVPTGGGSGGGSPPEGYIPPLMVNPNTGTIIQTGPFPE